MFCDIIVSSRNHKSGKHRKNRKIFIILRFLIFAVKINKLLITDLKGGDIILYTLLEKSVNWKHWLTMHDGKVCTQCYDKLGQIYAINDIVTTV